MKKTILFISTILLLTSCANSIDVTECLTTDKVGFWYGLWHGMIAPFSWVCSLFMDSVSIYATYNNGGWYDFGFILGIGALSSGSSKAIK